MKLKIALITIHWANNYGASLQVFATLKALEKYGEVSLIDYRNNYAGKGMKWVRFGKNMRDFLRVGKDVFRLFSRYKVIKKFENFSYKYLNLTERIENHNDLNKLNSQHDLFVSGSDQIWNPEIVNEDGSLDECYFLNFVDKKKKISYASSMGTHRYSKKELEKIIPLLKKYDSISIREKDSSVYLSKVLKKNVSHVLDPTLLHDANDWLNFFHISKANIADPYVLVYALKKDDLLKKTLEQVVNCLGIKVITIDQDPFVNFKNDDHIMDAGPEEFVKLFADASFVVTNSFHGACLSIVFNVPFVVTEPLTSINRIESLLMALRVGNRIVKDGSNAKQIVDEDIDFDQLNMNLNVLRASSHHYLANAINGIK